MTERMPFHVMISLYEDKRRHVELSDIRDCVLRYFGMPLKVFMSQKRTEPIVMARRYYCALAKELTKHFLREIGESIRHHHSSVIHALQTFSFMVKYEKEQRYIYENLKADILGLEIPHPNHYKYIAPKTLSERVNELKASELKFDHDKEVEEVIIDHSQNNNGYSHNHEQLYK